MQIADPVVRQRAGTATQFPPLPLRGKQAQWRSVQGTILSSEMRDIVHPAPKSWRLGTHWTGTA